jgi:hypothetical protein
MPGELVVQAPQLSQFTSSERELTEWGPDPDDLRCTLGVSTLTPWIIGGLGVMALIRLLLQ